MAALVPPFELIPQSGTAAREAHLGMAKTENPLAFSLLAVGSIRAGLLSLLLDRPLCQRRCNSAAYTCACAHQAQRLVGTTGHERLNYSLSWRKTQ
jgi:hypothetical protein